ncbi:MAG TPA: hypothetical protein VOB72_24420, partial [Candidatus Dormibacteraeota bacterium]|nr:hypothetical protein [Candidatus Dormibacteraeota bacterium]
MRWPFGWFARTPSPDTPSPSEGEGRGGGVARASGREWSGLPPIQRAAGDLAPTAAAREFAAGLPGAVGVPLALQPLGHARALDAPAGLVGGVALPVQPYGG